MAFHLLKGSLNDTELCCMLLYYSEGWLVAVRGLDVVETAVCCLLMSSEIICIPFETGLHGNTVLAYKVQ